MSDNIYNLPWLQRQEVKRQKAYRKDDMNEVQHYERKIRNRHPNHVLQPLSKVGPITMTPVGQPSSVPIVRHGFGIVPQPMMAPVQQHVVVQQPAQMSAFAAPAYPAVPAYGTPPSYNIPPPAPPMAPPAYVPPSAPPVHQPGAQPSRNVNVKISYGGYPQIQQTTVQEQTCPKCKGHGGWGSFGACRAGTIHYKQPCPCCGGRCVTYRVKQCYACQGKGSVGTFGPCEPHDIHRKGNCTTCQGAGYMV